MKGKIKAPTPLNHEDTARLSICVEFGYRIRHVGCTFHCMMNIILNIYDSNIPEQKTEEKKSFKTFESDF